MNRWLKWLLLPVGLLHWFFIQARRKMYDWRWLPVKSLPKWVISVGNLQLGGTGKSVLALQINNFLVLRGYRPALLTRGYRRTSKSIYILDASRKSEIGVAEIGDEPALFLNRITGGILGVGKNRYAVGMEILQRHEVDVFVMDDGMQHRRLWRDLEICLIDAASWPDHPLLVPFSSLREVKSGLHRADIILLTKNRMNLKKAAHLRKEILKKLDRPIWMADFETENFVSVPDAKLFPPDGLSGKRVGAFCGVGNPDYFFAMVAENAGELVWRRHYPDHHNFTFDEIENLLSAAKRDHLDYLICTEKDAVKLRDPLSEAESTPLPILALRVRFAIENPAEFWRTVDRLCRVRKTRP